MDTTRIIAIEDGFALVSATRRESILLDEIGAVLAYKVDELTTDLVCLDIVTRVGESEKVHTIHEELPGFDLALTSLEALPAFNRKWREAVILPPFATTPVTIYYRD